MRALLVVAVFGVVGCSAPMTPDAGLPACDAPTGTGTMHSGDITANETWTAAGSPHLISSDVRIFATVTVESCATVSLGERNFITVGSSTQAGKLIARNATFTAQDLSKPWGTLAVDVKGALDFENTALISGGNPLSAQNGGGMVVAYGVGSNQPVLTRSLRFVNVVATDPKGFVVNLQRMVGFTADSTGLAVVRPTSQVVLVEAGAAGTLPFITTREGTSEVLLEPRGSMPSDTIKNVGLPYRVNGRLLVAPSTDGSTSTLTIEAGVRLLMDKTSDSGLTIGTSDVRRGVLVAVGTAADPIVFTSGKATPAPGDWSDVYFRNTPTTGNRLEHAVVEYAGGFSGLQGYGCGPAENDASIIVAPDTGRPDTAFITNTTIRNGGGDTALLLGWVSDASGPDFTATNTFENVPMCKVSRWRNETGLACPGSTSGSPVCLL